jgi:PAS domain S-box-containing protein
MATQVSHGAGKILIVEDSSLQAKRLKRLLEEHGYETIVARNGQEGLAVAREKNPLLIVSDIVMPVMDGYEMCRVLKNDAQLKTIPVVLLTSLSDPRDVFFGLESGADSYVSKPYDADGLLERIETVLQNAKISEAVGFGEHLEIFLGGKQYSINSSRRQILNLLLSTYQDAVEQNKKLREVRAKLVTVNEKLEKLVAERTAALGNEVSERKRIESVLASEKERLSVTLRSINDGVITTNTEGIVILMNRAAEELTGWPQEEAVGKAITQVFDLTKTKTRDGGEQVVENILKSGSLLGLDDQITLRSRDSSERVVNVSGTPIFHQTDKIIGVVFVFRDITEAKRMEEDLIKAQKLESLGVLAGGIAHDFNNLLTAILGNVSLAKMQTNPDDKSLLRLQEAEKATLRAKDLTQQLLTFSKGGAPVKKVVAISELLRESALFAVRGSNVRCDVDISDDLWPVEIDGGQISQVVHNLMINADQAMPYGGVITVTARNLNSDSEHDSGLLPDKGRFVLISVKDEGHGIPYQHMAKVFDPYFTTKDKGSGLGLATSYSIMRNHGGTITIDSEPGLGSVFNVYIPASSGDMPRDDKASDKLVQGDGSVLVMDDEEMLRDFIGELLDHLGYEVGFAADGQETIDAYCKAKEAGKPFDCVLMDLTIPGGMGGKETIRKLRQIDPQIKAIVSSGYCDDPVMADFESYGFSGVVAKPYDAEELSVVLSRVMSKAN